MAIYNNVGDTIEGLAFDGDSRRWQAKGLVKHPKLAKAMKLYSCDRNSHVEISKVIDEPEDDSICYSISEGHGDRKSTSYAEVSALAPLPDRVVHRP